eukprot:TRINITY_DN914_c0_g1_i1.p1 TRINITY_DN914_c0_g1~~TRINITY_DN914_c0_g1_i1.p1  ORF type:complete len:279 (+),score=58.07 TRINITY_DN914_c0_g1_i1:72-908(+)
MEIAEDAYRVLGVSRYASLIEIKRAYKQKALQFHPDKNPDGENVFKRISDAYALLSDEQARQKYDNETRPKATARQARAASEESADEDPISARQRREKADEYFKDVFSFDKEMATKKGGWFGDFAKWREGVEAQKTAQQRELEEKLLQKKREEEAARVRAEKERQTRLRSIAQDVLEEWQQEMRNWEEKKPSVDEIPIQKTRKVEDPPPAMADWAEKEIESIRRQRERLHTDRLRSIPTEAEVDTMDPNELNAVLHALESRVQYIRDALKRKEQRATE